MYTRTSSPSSIINISATLSPDKISTAANKHKISNIKAWPYTHKNSTYPPKPRAMGKNLTQAKFISMSYR